MTLAEQLLQETSAQWDPELGWVNVEPYPFTPSNHWRREITDIMAEVGDFNGVRLSPAGWSALGDCLDMLVNVCWKDGDNESIRFDYSKLCGMVDILQLTVARKKFKQMLKSAALMHTHSASVEEEFGPEQGEPVEPEAEFLPPGINTRGF
jgi:hypothetical protein